MKIEIPERKKLVFETRFPVRWGDMDVMGHVNNTMYFRYMESARIDWLAAIIWRSASILGGSELCACAVCKRHSAIIPATNL